MVVYNALWSLCQRPTNAPQTPKNSLGAPWTPWQLNFVSVRAQWNKWYSAQAQCKRRRRGRVTLVSRRTPLGLHANATAYSGVLAAIMCVPAAWTRRPRGALGSITELLLRCYGELTAFPRRSFVGTPWERRAMASSADVTGIPRRSVGALGDPTAPRHSEFFLNAVQSPWGHRPGVTGV